MSKRTAFGLLLEKALEDAFGDWRDRLNHESWLPRTSYLDTIEKWVDEGTLPSLKKFNLFLSNVALLEEVKQQLRDGYSDLKNQRRRSSSDKTLQLLTEDQTSVSIRNNRYVPLVGLPNVIARTDINRLVGIRKIGQQLADKLLEDGAHFISVEGQGGIGKTATVLWTIDHIRQLNRFAGIVWITIGNYYSLDSGQIGNFGEQTILSRIAQLLQIDIEQNIIGILQETPYLIVVDNINTKEEATSVMDVLQPLTSGVSRVLITSRFSLTPQFMFVSPLELEPLSIKQVAQLLKDYSKVKLSTKKVNEIYGVVGGIPLALHLLASLAQTESITALINGIEAAQKSSFDKRGRISTMFEYLYGSIWAKLTDKTREFIVLFARQSPADGAILREYALISCCVVDDCLDLLEQGLRYYIITAHGIDDDQYLDA